jgi:carbon-monoxide dehydrogenase large subunit
VWRAIHANDGDAPTPTDAMPHFEEGALNQDEGAGQ